MPNREEILRPLRPALVPVPSAGQLGICPICHSSRAERYATCYPCAQAAPLDPPPILPVSMSVAGGALHYHLRQYKDSPSRSTRDRFTLRLAALVAVFMEHHATCIGAWDVVTGVPSARRRALDPVITKLKIFHRRHSPVLTARSSEEERSFDRGQFQVGGDLVGHRVLLLDDTFTTGARLFSAVAALRQAGATVVGPVVLGRHVEPSWGPSGEMMTWLAERLWTAEGCARCAGEQQHADRLF